MLLLILLTELAKELIGVPSKIKLPRRENYYKPTSGILPCLTQPRTQMTSSGYVSAVRDASH